MAQSKLCDNAALAAWATSPEAREVVQDMMRSQTDFNDRLLIKTYEYAMEAGIQTPSKMDWWKVNKEYEANFEAVLADLPAKERTRIQAITEAAGGYAAIAWDSLKQIRAALMLSNPSTHALNQVTNVGMAGSRVIEEGMAIAVSKLPWYESRSWGEMHAYRRGIQRALNDVPSVFSAAAKLMAKSGTAQTAEMKVALREVGYSPKLAKGKTEGMIGEVAAMDFGGNMISKGVQYMFNAAFGSQFSALQMADVVYKMVSHRAKVEQLLSREAFKKGLRGEAIDVFVSENWGKLTDTNTMDFRATMTPEEIDEIFSSGTLSSERLADFEGQGIRQAEEDTFTETPETMLGKLLTGNWEAFGKPTFWKKAVHESMQIISPFRSIYVNLMRQGLSRRLLPFFDPKTKKEWSGAMGPEAKQLAIARTTAAWGLAISTAGLIYQTKLKIHAPADLDPAVRDLQFELYGKVGNTLEYEGRYIPINAMAPQIAIPLTYVAAGMKAVEQSQYMYTDGDTQMEIALRFASPFMSAILDGPWVADYMGFLNNVSGHINYGSPDNLLKYLGSVVADPLKMPRWLNKYMGSDPYSKTTDGMVEKFNTEMRGRMDQFGYKRNMFGRRIMPLEMWGDNAEHPWFKGDSDVVSFLRAVKFDEAYPRNISMKIMGDANGKDGVRPGRDTVDMEAKAQDRFEELAATIRNAKGQMLIDEIRELSLRRGVYDSGSDTLLGNKIVLQTKIRDVMAERRQRAREIMQYHPAFKIREQQINVYYSAQLESGVDQGKAQLRKDRELKKIEFMRYKYRQYY